MSFLRQVCIFGALSWIGHAQGPLPIGLVTEAEQASIARAGLEDVGEPVYKGELLYAGETLTSAAGGRVSFAFCPTSSLYSSGPGAIKFSESAIVLDGKKRLSATATLPFCSLPPVRLKSARDVRTAADRIQAQDTATPAVELTPDQKAAMGRFDAALARDPADIAVLLARATALEAVGDYDGVLRDYGSFIRLAPKAGWAEDEVRRVAAERDRAVSGPGRTIGVVIGISNYPNLPLENQLQYADRDAEYFYRYLLTPRGGARPDDVALLLNEKAKSGDVKVAIANAFARAKPNDRVVIYIASHGFATLEANNRGGYILTYDSSKEDVATTAVPMEDLNDVIGGKLRPHQIQMFVDACYSGYIGGTPERHFNGFLAQFLDQNRPSAQVLGLLASGQTEPSYECSNLDAGHGAFTYFVVRGLNAAGGDAVDEARGQITVDSLFEYVHERVRAATKSQKRLQSPERRGNIDDRVELAETSAKGLSFTNASTDPVTCDGARGIQASPAKPQAVTAAEPFGEAIRSGRLLPGEAGSAFELLQTIQTTGGARYAAARNELLAALLDAGQQIILQYLKGEQVHMTREDFARGERLFEAAGQLMAGGDAYIQARRLFCKGRRLVFENNLAEAITTLREAIRVDVFGAYAYNALGIAFLETGDFKQSIHAFEDAIRLAPYWAYARHNLALAYTQEGQYTPAIATYRQAMLLGPEYAYIPYNLSLLFERLNRPSEARQLLEPLVETSPQSRSRAWAAIGLSYYLERRFDKAETAYRNGLRVATDETDRLAVRHDLALLLKDRSRMTEAIALWRLNLGEKNDDIPSLVGLSDALVETGDTRGALQEFSNLLKNKPDYTGARLRYAGLLSEAGEFEQSAAQLAEVLRELPQSEEASERLGDLHAEGRLGGARNTEALTFYQQALDNAKSAAERRRLRQKMKSVTRRPL